MARSFVDTNVFFYAVDARDRVKQAKARTLIAHLAEAGEGRGFGAGDPGIRQQRN